jgi:hypothetical protein
LTSAFLTLEIIPVIVTYWRLEQLLWERLASSGSGEPLRRLKLDSTVAVVGAVLAAALAVVSIYLAFPGRSLVVGESLAGLAFLGGIGRYVVHRPAARELVWPPAGRSA